MERGGTGTRGWLHLRTPAQVRLQEQHHPPKPRLGAVLHCQLGMRYCPRLPPPSSAWRSTDGVFERPHLDGRASLRQRSRPDELADAAWPERTSRRVLGRPKALACHDECTAAAATVRQGLAPAHETDRGTVCEHLRGRNADWDRVKVIVRDARERI